MLARFTCLFVFSLLLFCDAQLGIVTGGIYQGVPQSMLDNALNIFCEFKQLGVRWIRIQSDWPGTYNTTYQSIVQIAHANGIAVNVIVPAQYCGADNNNTAIDQFTSSYTSHLDYLITYVFSGSASVDAIEVGNEPNIEEAACPDGQTRFRVSPNAFAWLLKRVYQWKQSRGLGLSIISGGILNTYTTESFWSGFLNSGAFFSYYGSRPFDYFGIHPYDPYTIDQNCINSGQTNCFDSWGQQILTGLQEVQRAVDQATQTSGTPLFATEFGLQTLSSCPANANCVLNYNQQSAGMQAAVSAITKSGVCPLALWYDYRDDYGGPQTFGIRSGWNGGTYPAKQPTWSTFQQLAGGSGSNPDQCW